MDGTSADISDDAVRARLSHLTQQLRAAGFIGDTPATVGEAREPQIGVPNPLTDGMAPMIKGVPQQDR
jgi:hypothetical protein